MKTTLKLESTRYWLEIETERLRIDRYREVQTANQRLRVWTVFGVGVLGLTAAIASGAFQNVDLVGPLQQLCQSLGSAWPS